MDIFLLWWFAQANVIVGVLVFAVVASIVVMIFSGIAYTANAGNVFAASSDRVWERTRNNMRACKSVGKKASVALIVASVMLVAIPNRTGLAIIIGGKLSLDAIQSEEVSETAGKLYELVNRELDQRLEETEPDESE